MRKMKAADLYSKKNTHKIKGILIDSGGVLNGPISGHWMISPNFFDYVDRNKFNTIPKSKRQDAFRKAMNYIETILVIKDTEEEYNHFYKHYEIFFNELNELKIPEQNIKEITEDLVYNNEKYCFFDDAVELIPKLSKNYQLAVVSDAWPSLQNVFKKANFLKNFNSFILSCHQGVTKPDEKMYLAALNEIGCSAQEVIFIDDRLKNCIGAKKSGIEHTILMSRSNREYWYGKLTLRQHKVVKDFHGVVKCLKKLGK